jgi:hypothetical protein
MRRQASFTRAQEEFLNDNCNYAAKETIFLSFDIDWVPDYMLSFTADLVSSLDVSFMHTHASPVCAEVAEHFASGIHPNLQKPSDQGETIEDSIEFLAGLGVGFETCRFHVLSYGYPDLVKLSERGTKLDSSTILFNGKNIIPTYHHDLDMILAPYFWEDGIYLRGKDRRGSQEIIDWETPGLKIFDFHPLDIYLNTSSMKQRNMFKASVKKLQDTDEDFSRRFINNTDNTGNRDILIDLISKEKRGEITIKSLDTLNKEFRELML